MGHPTSPRGSSKPGVFRSHQGDRTLGTRADQAPRSRRPKLSNVLDADVVKLCTHVCRLGHGRKEEPSIMLARGTLSTRVRTMDIRHLDPAMAHPSKEPPPWAFPASSGTLLPPQTTPARDTDEYARPQNPGENPPPPQIPHPTATPPVDPTSSCT